jgi:hypothetical protein
VNVSLNNARAFDIKRKSNTPTVRPIDALAFVSKYYLTEAGQPINFRESKQTISDMAHPPTQPFWLAMPCIIVSLFTTGFMTPALKSHNEGGLSVVLKAALIFIVTLVLSTTATNLLLPSQSSDMHVESLQQEIGRHSDERVQAWRDSLEWSPSSSSEGEKRRRERAWKDEKRRKKSQKEDKEKKENRWIKRLLREKFAPKKNEMLEHVSVDKLEQQAKPLQRAFGREDQNLLLLWVYSL